MAQTHTFFFVAFIVALNSVVLLAENQSYDLQTNQKKTPALEEAIVNEASQGEEGGDRDKRTVLKKLGVKAGLIHLVFGKIDSLIDAKTRVVNELDKQNVIKNKKYLGLSPLPPVHLDPLLGNLLNAKKKFVSSAVSSIVQSKLSKVSGALGFASGGGHSSDSSGSYGVSSPASSSTTYTAVPASTTYTAVPSGAGASFGAGASVPGLASASFGAGASLPLAPLATTATFTSGASLPVLASASFGNGPSHSILGVTTGYI